MIDQRATSLKTGYESYFNQQSQSIIAGISVPNKLFNTEFTPDLENWTSDSTDGKHNPYRSMAIGGNNMVGFSTKNAGERTYARLIQQVTMPSTITAGTGYVSVSWTVSTNQHDLYSNL